MGEPGSNSRQLKWRLRKPDLLILRCWKSRWNWLSPVSAAAFPPTLHRLAWTQIPRGGGCQHGRGPLGLGSPKRRKRLRTEEMGPPCSARARTRPLSLTCHRALSHSPHRLRTPQPRPRASLPVGLGRGGSAPQWPRLLSNAGLGHALPGLSSSLGLDPVWSAGQAGPGPSLAAGLVWRRG